MRVASCLPCPILPWVMKEGESKKAALILMKNSHFDGHYSIFPASKNCLKILLNSQWFLSESDWSLWRNTLDLFSSHLMDRSEMRDCCCLVSSGVGMWDTFRMGLTGAKPLWLGEQGGKQEGHGGHHRPLFFIVNENMCLLQWLNLRPSGTI